MQINDAYDLQRVVQSLFDEALAVLMGEIEEDDMTAPTELEDLVQIKSFADALLLTNDAGIVLRLDNGAEFQMTIVQSKQGRSSSFTVYPSWSAQEEIERRESRVRELASISRNDPAFEIATIMEALERTGYVWSYAIRREGREWVLDVKIVREACFLRLSLGHAAPDPREEVRRAATACNACGRPLWSPSGETPHVLCWHCQFEDEIKCEECRYLIEHEDEDKWPHGCTKCGRSREELIRWCRRLTFAPEDRE